jgi:hypothetical protein
VWLPQGGHKGRPYNGIFLQLHSRECAKRDEDEKAANWHAAQRTKSLPSGGEAKRNSSKMNERCGNVYENKGSLWKTWERGWNVYENKGT